MDRVKYDIFCIGACVQDILLEGIEEEDFKNSVTVLKRAVFTSGGDATNEAVVLSRLGNKTALLAKIDTGMAGNAVYQDLRNEGVDTSQIVRDEHSRSTSAFVAIDSAGNHKFFLAKGENEGIALNEIDCEGLKNTRAVCVGSMYTSYHLDRCGMRELMQAAREAGAVTFADMDHDVEKLGPHAMDHVLPYVDYLLPSMDEAVYITGEQDERKAAAEILRRGVKTVVIKLGAKGCYVRDAKTEFYMDPFCIEAKDTTGCGDNFVAGFIHSVLKGRTLKESARFACAVGAVNSTQIGGHMAVKSERQIEEFMNTASQRRIER